MLEEEVAKIASAYISHNTIAADQIPVIIFEIHTALRSLSEPRQEPTAPAPKPAVSIRRSVQPDAIICLECGWAGKMIKRHLASKHSLSPDAYRARWQLSSDYPMAAPNYTERRSQFAKAIGLGRTRAADGAILARAEVDTQSSAEDGNGERTEDTSAAQTDS
jgi:predicted transcriptional regulator